MGASKVASLGLLGLALQIAKVNGLDVWHVALKPFTLLCVEADSGPDSAVTGLADTARGPPQAYMFVNSDGCGICWKPPSRERNIKKRPFAARATFVCTPWSPTRSWVHREGCRVSWPLRWPREHGRAC